MDTNKALAGLNVVLALGAVVSMIVGALFVMDARHQAQTDAAADAKKLLETEVDLRQEILNRDIKKDSEVRFHYNSKKLLGTLDAADEQRLEYIEEQLEEKYVEQRALQVTEDKLK